MRHEGVERRGKEIKEQVGRDEPETVHVEHGQEDAPHVAVGMAVDAEQRKEQQQSEKVVLEQKRRDAPGTGADAEPAGQEYEHVDTDERALFDKQARGGRDGLTVKLSWLVGAQSVVVGMKHQHEQHGHDAEQLEVRLARSARRGGKQQCGHTGRFWRQRYAFAPLRPRRCGQKKSLPTLVAGIFRTAMRKSVKERDARREVVERRAEVGVQHVAGRVFHVEADGAILELAHEVDGDA